jgi:Trypsin
MKVLFVLSALCAIALADDIYRWSDIRPVELLPFFQERLRALKVPARTVEHKQRIVGGEIATPHQFPYQVSLNLHFEGGTGFCGGSVLSNK